MNACLDHRAEVFIPELSKTFHIQHEKTRLFACQNPLNQGGGRKGLPRSFLNRFTQVGHSLSQQVRQTFEHSKVGPFSKEKLENTKAVNQRRKDSAMAKRKKDKRTNNVLQNISQKTKN